MPPERRPTAILFDWDNTLIDGWAAIEAGLDAAFDAFGLPRWTPTEVKERVRLSLRDSFPAVFGADWERARDVFYAAVTERHLAVLRPMPGALVALDAAARCGTLAVISNKQGMLLRAEAEHLGWTGRFAAMIGAGDAAADKPDAAPFHMALAACGVPAGPEVWYVGDTGIDMQGARAAGLTGVLLGDAEHDGGVARLAPDRHFADGHALAAALARL